MSRLWLLWLLWLCGCPLVAAQQRRAHPQWTPQCRTSCGLALVGDKAPPWWSCSEFQAAEDRTLSLWRKYVDPSKPAGAFLVDDAKVCSALGHNSVWLVPGESFNGRGGEALCDSGVARIAASTRITSAFPHELVHLLQDCRGGETHSGWADAGIQAAVDAFDRGEPKEAVP